MSIYATAATDPLLVIYSQVGLGLGHMRRTSSIANRLLQMRPDASALTLSDSPLGPYFPSTRNHDYLKLPSIVKDGPDDWHAARLSLPFGRMQRVRERLTQDVLLDLSPDILLVDHMPHVAMGELVPALHALRKSTARAKVVLGLRDILDAPAVIQRRWEVEGAFAAVEAYYDLMLVYGMRELFDMATEYQFPPRLVDQLHYCGYVCAPRVRQTDAKMRTKLLAGASSNTKLIVAMSGGGADAYPMMSALLNALPEVQRNQRARLILITGPFTPAKLRRDLRRRAQGSPVRVFGAVEETYKLLRSSGFSRGYGWLQYVSRDSRIMPAGHYHAVHRSERRAAYAGTVVCRHGVDRNG